jgi:hypothetical protein
MRKLDISIALILFLCVAFENKAAVISDNPKRSGFYFIMNYPLIKRDNMTCRDKYCDDYYESKLNMSPYKLRTPAIGIKNTMNFKRVFFEGSIAYFYAQRSLDHDLTFNSFDPEAKETTGTIFRQQLLLGQKYYNIKDSYNGSVSYHYFTFAANFGFIFRHSFKYYFTANVFYNQSYKYLSNLKRTATEFEIIGVPAPYQYTTIQNGTTEVSYNSTQTKDKLYFGTRDDIFLGGGVEYEFNINQRKMSFGAELLRSFSGYYYRKTAINLRLSLFIF